MTSRSETAALLDRGLGVRDMSMTFNHMFGSCKMNAGKRRGAVDLDGKVYGVDGLYIVDTSIFPSPSAVNPQATCMALAEVITQRLARNA